MSSTWYVRGKGQVFGPLDDQRLVKLAAEGKIDADTEIAQNQNGPWYPAAKVKGLTFAAAHPTPAAATRESRLVQNHPELPVLVTDFIAMHLMEDEILIAVGHMHPIAVIIAGCCLAIGAVYLVAFGWALWIGPLSLVATTICLNLVIAGMIALPGLLIRLWATEYSCTNRRLLVKEGLIATRLREMPLEKVEQIRVSQGLIGKLCGCATLVFVGSGGSRQTFACVKQPFDFYKRVQRQVAIAQKIL